MPKLDDVLNNLIYPLLVILLAPIVTIIGSQLATGDYTNWIKQVPTYAKVGFVVGIIIWIGIILVRKRLKALEPSGVGVTSVSRYGYQEIARTVHDGVKWRVLAPYTHPASLHRGPDLTPTRIRVGLTPRCPKCETELDESKSFWGGHKWNCVRCNWNKRSKASFRTIQKRVEKIVQRELEMKQFENDEL